MPDATDIIPTPHQSVIVEYKPNVMGDILPAAASLAITTYAPTVEPVPLWPAAASLTITGYAPTVDARIRQTNTREIPATATIVKAVGSSTASVANTSVDLAWTDPEIPADVVSISGAAVTINATGTYVFQVTARTTSANRTELVIQAYKDTGSGYVAVTDDIASDYVAVDTDQNTGGVTLSTALELDSGDDVKFEATGDCDGTCVLTTAGTLLVITAYT